MTVYLVNTQEGSPVSRGRSKRWWEGMGALQGASWRARLPGRQEGGSGATCTVAGAARGDPPRRSGRSGRGERPLLFFFEVVIPAPGEACWELEFSHKGTFEGDTQDDTFHLIRPRTAERGGGTRSCPTDAFAWRQSSYTGHPRAGGGEVGILPRGEVGEGELAGNHLVAAGTVGEGIEVGAVEDLVFGLEAGEGGLAIVAEVELEAIFRDDGLVSVGGVFRLADQVLFVIELDREVAPRVEGDGGLYDVDPVFL